MKLLAFELATEACSVSLWLDGEVRERFEVAPRRHAELALPWAAALLAEAGIARSQLDAIAVGRGPGAFTGVRLAIAIGQGVALALDRPMVGISTLAALARQAGEGRVLATIDARMSEVYAATYERSGDELRLLDSETVGPPDQVRLPDDDTGWHGVGTGLEACDGALRIRLADRLASAGGHALPRAGDVAHLGALAATRGELVAPERVEPAYLRNNVALTLAQQQALRERR
ncbi:glycoprotease [Lysobacter arseniciresistens ZS79]|uniref:tRNA threonylcarbamoyladenosine biosynthesis protein TsaB n=1 Tax=Lysobacter arseniciresistens ZS79 TaxID=913325 RepID=A0A0A0F2P1_9GAMM|nr:tRNA (adenosine(37)-N6)-threonylcarbamoyltransferase complex dimerization subunit type 1 TsaB [Lysobacter arseniciresistens]KGM56628.1 glycoprotease [Lysobacter arseniciresistens ZS79]